MSRIRTNIMGTKIDAVTKKEALGKIEKFLQSDLSHHVVTPNAEFILQARKDDRFRHVLNNADLAVLDGSGPLIASWFTGVKLKERVPGSDLVRDVLGLADEHKLSVLHINRSGSLSPSAEIERAVRSKYPGLRFISWELPADRRISKKALERIKEAAPQIIMVGLGSPIQDFWIADNSNNFPELRLAMGIGGSFDFISGRRRRAPKFFKKTGTEWLYRLFSKPRGGQYYFGKRLCKIARSVIWFPLVFVFTFNKK